MLPSGIMDAVVDLFEVADLVAQTEAFGAVNLVNEEGAVEMVDLMLEGARVQPLG